MKTITRKNILLVFLTILTLFPMISVAVQANIPKLAQDEPVIFVSGSAGAGVWLGDWDPAISTSGTYGALEGLIWLNNDASPQPQLATSWTIHPRADEGSNTGGMAAISFNLRQNVTFTDGLKWNASVCKWNYDRLYNITGQTTAPENKWQTNLWFDPVPLESHFTPNWNLTWGFSDPFGNGKIPIINETIIVSEYVVNFTLNKWTTVMEAVFPGWGMISSETYEDFATTVIRGYSGLAIQHLVGTGPYIFVWADQVVTMSVKTVKNENYWMKDELEAEGLFVVDEWYERRYATAAARTTALLAGEVDSSGYQLQNQLTDMPALNASAYHEIYPTTSSTEIDSVQMLGREGSDVPIVIPSSSPFFAFNGLTLRQMFPSIAPAIGLPGGTQLAKGVNKSVRRAISYAFNYDNYIDVQYENTGGVRIDNPFGTYCIFNDHTVPYPDYDLTKARDLLLDDPYYEAQATARGLDINSTDNAWTGIAASNPIETLTFLTFTGSVKAAELEAALNNIGFAINNTYTTIGFDMWMFSRRTLIFDMFTYVWPSSRLAPWDWMGIGMNNIYNSEELALPLGGYNFAMLQNSIIDQLMADIPWAGEAAQPMYNNLSAMLYREAPHLFIAHGQMGVVVNAGWEVETTGYYAPLGQGLRPKCVGGARLTATPPSAPEIPGYPSLMLVLFSFVSILGISYSITKKRRKH